MKAGVSKLGNKFWIRIPLALAREAGIEEGDYLSIAVDLNGGIVLRPAIGKYELSSLVAGITAKSRRREINWGTPQGKESW